MKMCGKEEKERKGIKEGSKRVDRKKKREEG
jgi:hypothetical protein